MNNQVKELLVLQKLKSGQKLTDEELTIYAAMNNAQQIKSAKDKSDKTKIVGEGKQ